jgi:Sel1 repeat
MSGMATAAVAVETKPRAQGIVAAKAMLLPAAFAAALAAVALVPSVQTQPRLVWSILGAAGTLGIATLALAGTSRGRAFVIDLQLRPQHYLQACAQSSVLLYWGWYWRPVYDAIPLLIAQLLFAYAFDILLAWARRNTYTLGFAPFPVIFSINLFLWFKPDWFYLQFLMIAVGFAAKELIRWEKDGRRTHVFNPSSFPLAVFSLGLILTGTTSMTYGPEIAVTQFRPPYIYLFLFLIGLPGQYLFGVTTMTMSAVVTTYLFGVAYYWATGSYFFIDSYIPIAVFLGMHLLFTDPSTSPRSELGRVIFGVMYGLGNIILYEVFRQIGVPSFYDKLLPVPIMNLSIKLIDRVARSSWLSRFDPAKLAPSLTGRRRNLAYISVWTAIFVALSVTEGVGDNHNGQRVPFWQNACMQNARGACENLAIILDSYCNEGSGWACNEVGALRMSGRVENVERVGYNFARACDLGVNAACENVLLAGQRTARQPPPTLKDYPIVLQSGKGPLEDQTPLGLLTQACADEWMSGCEALGSVYLRGGGDVPRDPVKAASYFERACTAGVATACSNLGLMHHSGDGLPRDVDKGLGYLQRACDLGYGNACRWLKESRTPEGTK